RCPSGRRKQSVAAVLRQTCGKVYVVESLPEYSPPVEVGNPVSHEIRDFHMEGVLPGKQLAFYYSNIGRPYQGIDSHTVDEHARTFLYRSQIQQHIAGPGIRQFHDRGIAGSARKAVAAFHIQRRPRPQCRYTLRLRQFGPTLNKGQVPGPIQHQPLTGYADVRERSITLIVARGANQNSFAIPDLQTNG